MTANYIPQEVRERVRLQADNRCGYCRSHQRYVLGLLEIEHIIPTARGGKDDEDNLWLACRLCNGYKSTQIDGFDVASGQRVGLFNPRRQHWSNHFRWNTAGDLIIGFTPRGRVTVNALQLNNLIAVMVRRAWVSAGWHPPTEDNHD
jgi:hypothetical protein